jgi:hypothetical protein
MGVRLYEWTSLPMLPGLGTLAASVPLEGVEPSPRRLRVWDASVTPQGHEGTGWGPMAVGSPSQSDCKVFYIFIHSTMVADLPRTCRLPSSHYVALTPEANLRFGHYFVGHGHPSRTGRPSVSQVGIEPTMPLRRQFYRLVRVPSPHLTRG